MSTESDTPGPFEGAGPEARFRAYLAEGRFMIQRSASSGAHVFYPRTVAPGTGAADLGWVEASGLGTVYSSTCNRQRPEKGGDYNIALIDLDEGPRMMARVEGLPPDQVPIGLRVRARIGELDGAPAVIFHPEESA
ncbi:MAG: OB-fold domain-containing protein [Pseudomonadota bacterium]